MIKPYYETENGKLYHGECLDIMSQLDIKFDMILCDLPYGTTQNKWDIIIPFEPLWEQYKRAVKDNSAIVLTASQPFTSMLICSNLAWFKYEWMWVKNNATGHLNAKIKPMSIFESIVVFSRKKHTYNPQGLVPFNKKIKRGGNGENYGKSGTENFQANTNYPIDVLCFNSDSSKIHPTQKPVALFEYLIKTYTNEGGIVLDNCAGSGTTGVACENTNRKYILIEQDEKYCEVTAKRLQEATKQTEVNTPSVSTMGIFNTI